MAELERQDVVLQPEQQGVEQQTVQQEGQEVTSEEVLHDDTDPIEVLKATAMQLGIDVEELAILTKKELQSLIDRQITQAIKTREEKLRREEEKRRLETEGKFQELLRLERKEALEDYKQAVLRARNLPEFLAAAVQVDSFLDLPFVEAKQKLEEQISQIAQAYEQHINELIQKRTRESQKGTTTPVGNTAKVVASFDDELRKFFSR